MQKRRGRKIEQLPIIQLELTESRAGAPALLEAVGAWVICRFRGAVVGQFEAPVQNGRVQMIAALEGRLSQIAWNIWRSMDSRPQAPALRASIVVCTRDRTGYLEACLSTLEPLVQHGHEVIVIDSCPSNEATKRLMEKYVHIRDFHEPRPGQGIARNRGLKEASGDVIAFIDDDAEAVPLWLDSLLRNFADPVVALVTGVALPKELETEAQIWFERTNAFHRGFQRREFDIRNLEPLVAGVLGAGVNMAVRRDALADIGVFDEALGPGTVCRSGDDHEFFYRVLSRGHRAVYDPAAVVWHKHRREWAALRRALYGYGVGVFAWWTRALVFGHEWGLLRVGTGWFFGHYVKNFWRSLLRRPGCMPPDLAAAELLGALSGPFAYFRARRQLRKESRRDSQSPRWARARAIQAEQKR